MRISLGLSLLLGALSLASCSSKVSKALQPTEHTLATYKDSLAYAFGAVNGSMYAQVANSFPKDTLDKETILKGFSDAFFGKNTAISTEYAQSFVTKHIKALDDADRASYIARNDSALLANKTKEGVVTTESGLQYRILRPGKTNQKPKAEDTVEVHYAGRLISGQEFDSSYKRHEPIKFPLNQVIKGWTEGLQLMDKGAKYEFYIPASLAYGDRGAGKDIPPHSTLIFEVELLDIIPSQASVDMPQDKAEKSTSPQKARKNKKKK